MDELTQKDQEYYKKANRLLSVATSEQEALDVLKCIAGIMEKKKDSWKPLSMKRGKLEKNLELSDASGYSFTIFSKRALELLRPLIRKSVEELELQFSEAEYYGINTTVVLDVIDYDKSEYRTFSDGKKIMVFEKYVFKVCDELLNHHIFKIIDEPTRWEFVSDKFKQVVEENHLTGLEFKLVWDSGPMSFR